MAGKKRKTIYTKGIDGPFIGIDIGLTGIDGHLVHIYLFLHLFL